VAYAAQTGQAMPITLGSTRSIYAFRYAVIVTKVRLTAFTGNGAFGTLRSWMSNWY